MAEASRIREIPYNYTSFSDREIVLRYLGQRGWDLLNQLRGQRVTGRSARMLFEVLGDIWVVDRNPYIQDDLLAHGQRRELLLAALRHRLAQITARADPSASSGHRPSASSGSGALALQLVELAIVAVEDFATRLRQQGELRQALRRAVRSAADNLSFDGLARVSHATDATDWRVAPPLAVLYPDDEAEIPGMIAACAGLGLSVIARGGGTGYTASGVPLHPDCVVLNTEKLDWVSPVERIQLPGTQQTASVVRVGAGAVTRRVADVARAAGLIFAVDPTSIDASTIGGNIAMNAGGKKAVRWGTTLDNLLSWRMVMADATWLEVERQAHNLGKIDVRETVHFRLTRYARDGRTPLGAPTLLSVPGAGFRQAGLGKDVTDKALFGLPGAQKEGCDGIITSACFVLHPQPVALRAVCLEFFGTVAEAVPAIEEIIAFFHAPPSTELQGTALRQAQGTAQACGELQGLEHMDARYVRAVQYTPKSARGQLPRMVLIADVAGHSAAEADQAAQAVVALAQQRGGEGFIAVSDSERARFWADRARTAAIAAHTNAFKVNEDVVIPLARLAEYSDGIERINIEYSIRNKLEIVAQLRAWCATRGALAGEWATQEDEDSAEARAAAERDKLQRILALLDEVEARWRDWLARLDEVEWFRQMQSCAVRVSFRAEVAHPSQEILAGQAFANARAQIAEIHTRVRASRLFVATHMHAGDGNVHTNIPVNSNDYNMMQEAERIVHRVMALAQALGGVISGEHGIGLTKYQFLAPEKARAFAEYKAQVDPNGVFNRGKLLPGSGLANAYTPSLRLLEQEALILQAGALEHLNEGVKNCLRCGKCKAVCTTHVPGANLLYSPRNKILALGLIIEAVLYEEQTRRGISASHWRALRGLADHCTVCRRCLKPCPVRIDFGEITVGIREVLRARGYGRKPPAAWLGMQFLKLRQPSAVYWMRKIFIEGAYAAQRLASAWFKPLARTLLARPPATIAPPSIPAQIIHFVAKPLPGHLLHQPLRRLLRVEDDKQVAIVRNPQRTEAGNAVFYFPGCGSERLFTEIGLATLAMLYELGDQVVLPPGYLCCGYPQAAGGDAALGADMTARNRILFHRVANTLNYLDIKTVLVSCGTCLDQLREYRFEQIFPGCRLLDIHEYLYEQGVTLPESTPAQRYLYHDPCHTPMRQHPPLRVASALLGQKVVLSDRCCGEAGTFAVARPDIATQARFRKEQEIRRNLAELNGATDFKSAPAVMLTACPACRQGLDRYRNDVPIQTRYLVEELARLRLGADWQASLLANLRGDAIERVLL